MNVTLKSHSLKIKISVYEKQQQKVVESWYPWPMIYFVQQKYYGVLYSLDCRTFTALVKYHYNNLSHICGELDIANFKPAA